MYKQGATILIPFPFTDLTGSKIRPAVIVGNKTYGEDIIVVFISSNIKTKTAYDVLIKPSEQNGLKIASLLKCTKLATLDKKMIIGEIGLLSSTDLAKVKSTLKSIFF